MTKLKVKGKGKKGKGKQNKGAPPPKMWGGRFTQGTLPLVERFTHSLHVDQRLAPYDIQGSIAHCRTLQKAKVLSARDAGLMIKGLEIVRGELERGRFSLRSGDEDIHMAIERRLTEVIGPVGGKLHTGRSRNDQVALDLRLFLRDSLGLLLEAVRRFQLVLVNQAQVHLDVVMPGYTHLQRAQPVLFAHHLLAYVEMLSRDQGRLRDALSRVNVMPLGSGALAGSNYPVDRAFTAALLGFSRVTENSLDAVSDRDFAIEVLAVLAILMMHLSRLSEELVLWASQEFQFVELPDGFCTGSSMMPQKKNPDVPELVRGKTGRMYGHLFGLLTVMKGLPLSYNRDLQEDKEPVFDAVDTALLSLEVLTALMEGLRLNQQTMSQAVDNGSMLATELADYLVMKQVPFREAHHIVGRIVKSSLDRGVDLREFSLRELRGFSNRFAPDVLRMLTVEGAIARKAKVGGTSRKQVERRIATLKKRLS